MNTLPVIRQRLRTGMRIAKTIFFEMRNNGRRNVLLMPSEPYRGPFIKAKRRRPGDLETREDLFKKSKTNDVDVFPQSFDTVDFGHVYRDNKRDPYKGTDTYGPDIIEPRNIEQARQLLMQLGSDIRLPKKEEPVAFANPRDAIIYLNPSGRREAYESDKMAYRPGALRITPSTIDNPIQEQVEIKNNHFSATPPQAIRVPEERLYTNTSKKSDYFYGATFELLSDKRNYQGNWTTCKEFAKGAVFHPDDIINIEWVPFYIWSERQFTFATVHTFSYLTKKVVKQYKETYGPYLNMKVDWEEPKLLMRGNMDMLLIAGDRKGLFYGIQLIDLPANVKRFKIKVPVIVLRIKIVDPYLALMYCDEKYATIMTEAGNDLGSPQEKIAEANKALKFNGNGNPAERNLKEEFNRAKFRKLRRPGNSTLRIQ